MANGLVQIESTLATSINCDMQEFRRMREIEDRRLYLYGEIQSLNSTEDYYSNTSMTAAVMEYIIEINRMDDGVEPEKRDPIRLYINSPGGEPAEGFALISVMELSKTPIYTINVGECSSMAFLVSIAGHKRFSLPYSTFLMHDGSIFVCGTTNKVKDQISFEDRFGREVIKPFVLKHGKMPEEKYDSVNSDEFYMTANDALEYGFIDEIVSSIDDVF